MGVGHSGQAALRLPRLQRCPVQPFEPGVRLDFVDAPAAEANVRVLQAGSGRGARRRMVGGGDESPGRGSEGCCGRGAHLQQRRDKVQALGRQVRDAVRRPPQRVAPGEDAAASAREAQLREHTRSQ